MFAVVALLAGAVAFFVFTTDSADPVVSGTAITLDNGVAEPAVTHAVVDDAAVVTTTVAPAGGVLGADITDTTSTVAPVGSVDVADSLAEIGRDCASVLAPADALIDKLDNGTLTLAERNVLQEIVNDAFAVCPPDEWLAFTFLELTDTNLETGDVPDLDDAVEASDVESGLVEDDASWPPDHDPSDPDAPDLP